MSRHVILIPSPVILSAAKNLFLLLLCRDIPFAVVNNWFRVGFSGLTQARRPAQEKNKTQILIKTILKITPVDFCVLRFCSPRFLFFGGFADLAKNARSGRPNRGVLLTCHNIGQPLHHFFLSNFHSAISAAGRGRSALQTGLPVSRARNRRRSEIAQRLPGDVQRRARD